MLASQPPPEFPPGVLVQLAELLGRVQHPEVVSPPTQDRVELSDLVLEGRTLVSTQGRPYLAAYPLHGPARRPRVAPATTRVAPAGRFPEVHPEEVESVLGRRQACLFLVDGEPEFRLQKLPQYDDALADLPLRATVEHHSGP